MSPGSGGGCLAVFKDDMKTSNPASTDIFPSADFYIRTVPQSGRILLATDLDITHCCQYIFNRIYTLIIIPINPANKIRNSAGVDAAEGRLYAQYFCFKKKSTQNVP